jgi:hypothetical protein
LSQCVRIFIIPGPSTSDDLAFEEEVAPAMTAEVPVVAQKRQRLVEPA